MTALILKISYSAFVSLGLLWAGIIVATSDDFYRPARSGETTRLVMQVWVLASVPIVVSLGLDSIFWFMPEYVEDEGSTRDGAAFMMGFFIAGFGIQKYVRLRQFIDQNRGYRQIVKSFSKEARDLIEPTDSAKQVVIRKITECRKRHPAENEIRREDRLDELDFWMKLASDLKADVPPEDSE